MKQIKVIPNEQYSSNIWARSFAYGYKLETFVSIVLSEDTFIGYRVFQGVPIRMALYEDMNWRCF